MIYTVIADTFEELLVGRVPNLTLEDLIKLDFSVSDTGTTISHHATYNGYAISIYQKRGSEQTTLSVTTLKR